MAWEILFFSKTETANEDAVELSREGLGVMLQTQSTLVVILLGMGVLCRRQRSRHVRLMSVAIAWDILLVVQIELNRSALAKAAQFLTNKLLLNVHVAAAILTVLCYGIMIYTGRSLLRGETSLRRLHRQLGWSTLGLRLFVYVTSFFVVT